MTGASAVAVADVTKRFGHVTALDGFTLEIERGQFVSLLGPSGCGKTTLLRILAGLELPTAGRVSLDGRDVTGVPAQKRGLGFAFQRYALFPHMTVLENVGFGLRVRGVPRGERRRRAQEMLELVELGEYASRLPAQLSGGQAQRVALARALAPRPPVLLLDEPLAALDLAVRTAMQEELRRIHRELGTTFVYVTHDQGEALTMSDRIVLMRAGRIEQDSLPGELYRAPQTLFAATFVGESNVWRGTALAPAQGGDAVRVRLADGGETGARAITPLADGDAILAVVRPQALVVAPPRVSLDGLELRDCTVTDVLVRGARALVLARSGDLELRIEAEAGDAELLAADAAIRVGWPASAVTVFGATS